jgi:hypothetical protein
MNSDIKNGGGYVYILKVRDIQLPVCKIGRTSKSPSERCNEINRSSTGDFIWEVAFEFLVNDCEGFERLVHKKLKFFRQKRREFFNLTPESAFQAIQSILDEQSDYVEIRSEMALAQRPTETIRSANLATRRNAYSKQDAKYADLFAQFTKYTNCKGKPFGQLNRPHFGISDGNDGVQWNLVVNRETDEIRLGVNLEGMKYRDWPIASFLLNELEAPKLFDVRDQLNHPDRIYLQLTRDAWQVTARPKINEQYIGQARVPFCDISLKLWRSMVQEGLSCLNKEKDFRGRAAQSVTLWGPEDSPKRERTMEVSPHMNIWTPIDPSVASSKSISDAVELLKPIHKWVSLSSQ